MKTNWTIKSRVSLLAVILMAGILFSSCLKTEDQFVPSEAALSIVNGYSGNVSVDFYLDNQKVNTQPLLYQQSTEYIRVYSGQRKLTITNSGTTKTLADGGLSLTTGKYYTVFLAKKSAFSSDTIVAIPTEDDLTPPSSGKAKIRLANLTPGENRIDVYAIEAAGPQILFERSGFKSVSPFIEINAGTRLVVIRENGNITNPDIEIKKTFSLTLEAGKIYTLSTNGLWYGEEETMDAYGTQLTVHK